MMEVHLAQPSGPSDHETPRAGVGAGTTRQGDPQPTTTGPAHSTTGQAGELGQQARAVVDDVKREARDAAEHAKHAARATAASQKDAAADRMGGYAHALNSASDDLRDRGQDLAANYVHQAAGGLEHAANVIRERDVDQLLGTVEDFARRQPVAFLGAAVAAGFGLARLMKSSAHRRHGTSAGIEPQSGGLT
jgi:hypothetical protein